MFADSKNPLAADLVKELKAISIDKSSKRNHDPRAPISPKSSQSAESPSTILLSRLRSKENDKSNEKMPANLNKPDIFKRYSVDMIDLSLENENKSLTPSTIP